jgi:hypothetical protein
VRLAARGARETEAGVVAVDSAGEVSTLRSQAARVWRESITIAVVVTAVVMLARTMFCA